MTSWKSLSAAQRLEKVEAAYLLALRVAGLLAATACLLVALFLSGDALWRFAVRTEVVPEPTAIDSVTLARLVGSATPSSGQSRSSEPSPFKVSHDAFKKDFWPSYYEIYRKSAQQYPNAQGPIISSDELMTNMGYDFDTYEAAVSEVTVPEAITVVRLVSDGAYQQAALKHVGEAIASNAVRNRLSAFTRATKSEQKCTTTPVTQRVNQVCGYYYVYDCSYTRTIQQRRCEQVFPDNILSPVAAFAKADAIFADQWLSDEARKKAAANSKSADRQALRDGILPRFQSALTIIGGFLIIMFFFLLIAIERHLRPAKKEAAQVVKSEPTAGKPTTNSEEAWL